MDTGFFLILIACGLYGLIHSVLASNTTKVFAMRQVGQAAYHRFYRLFFVLMAGLTTLVVLAMVPFLPDRILYRIPAPWSYLTIAVQAAAAAAVLVGVWQTGAMSFLGLKQIVASDTDNGAADKLVVTGLYRWVRHPLYTASLLFLWLAPLMTWNLLALNIGFSAYLLIGTIFEERKLIEQFGEEYLRYRQKTPRIIPGIKIT